MKKQKKDIITDNLYVRKLNANQIVFDIIDFYNFDRKKYPYLLESSAKGNKRERFSIIFCEPKTEIVKRHLEDNEFLKKLDQKWESQKVLQNHEILKEFQIEIPFTGGWFVYLGYELINEIEKTLKIPDSPYSLPTAFASRVKSAVIYDHLEKNIFFISEESISKVESMHLDFENIQNILHTEDHKRKIEPINKGTDTEHQRDVKACIDYIFKGEIFQANLSRLWEFEISDKYSDSIIYKELQKTNPSPFAGLLNFDDSSIISSSPERLVSLKNGTLETRPIAGTRPRGINGVIDVELSRELISSEKERAEHLMLVDLERNDISRVCKPGTVIVDEMMVIESYSHVHHIVSNIKGSIKDDIRPGEILAAVFPGGTITGCPKIRCIEILGELEKIGRGPYTGSFGYINHNGNLDFNILIRSMVMEHQKISLRAGGGIVADSIPEKETSETEAKANAMLKALQNVRI